MEAGAPAPLVEGGSAIVVAVYDVLVVVQPVVGIRLAIVLCLFLPEGGVVLDSVDLATVCERLSHGWVCWRKKNEVLAEQRVWMRTTGVVPVLSFAARTTRSPSLDSGVVPLIRGSTECSLFEAGI